MPFNHIKDDEQTNATASLNSEFTVKEFEDMILQVDKRYKFSKDLNSQKF
jgi:hypothetical protein